VKKNKVLFLSIIFCFFIISAFIVNSQENINESRWVTADTGLNMRDAPKLNAKKIGLIPCGEQVLLIEETGRLITISGATGRWSKIKWKGRIGWVFGAFLTNKYIKDHTGDTTIQSGGEITVEKGTEILRVAWGSGEGELGFYPRIPEGSMSFFVGFGEEIYILDQLNSRVQVYQGGLYQRTTWIPAGYRFQDIAESQDNDLILLDRLYKKAVVFLTSSGKLDCEVGLIGDKISDADSVTGIYSRYDGVWVWSSSKLIRIAKADGMPDPDRPSVPGYFSNDDVSLLSAERDGELSVVLNVSKISQPNKVSRHVIWFDMLVAGIEVLDSDWTGRIFLGVRVSPETGEQKAMRSYIVMVILNKDMSERRRFLMPYSMQGEPMRSIRVGDGGVIYQMRFDAKGAAVTRYKP